MRTLDYKKISNIKFDGIITNDHPDYSDAYIIDADYDGETMTEDDIELLNDDSQFVYEKLIEHLF
jgi:hypothetical protein